MKIEVETNGDSRHTTIKLNGVTQELSEFNLSIKGGHKCKIQLRRMNSLMKKMEFVSYFGEDFNKYDGKVEEQFEVIGTKDRKTKELEGGKR